MLMLLVLAGGEAQEDEEAAGADIGEELENEEDMGADG